jgi:uncharacterized membrane protein
MAKGKPPVNPFYILLVISGIAFTVTACAYGVMAFKANRAAALGQDAGAGETASGSALLARLDRHGPLWMAVELVLLGLATLGAIGTDRYRMLRAQRQRAAQDGTSGEP